MQLCKHTLKYSTKPTDRQAELMARGLPKRAPLPGVQDIVIVASGKGGVGKSTTSGNFCFVLLQNHHSQVFVTLFSSQFGCYAGQNGNNNVAHVQTRHPK